jgi:hypothetical protein
MQTRTSSYRYLRLYIFGSILKLECGGSEYSGIANHHAQRVHSAHALDAREQPM